MATPLIDLMNKFFGALTDDNDNVKMAAAKKIANALKSAGHSPAEFELVKKNISNNSPAPPPVSANSTVKQLIARIDYLEKMIKIADARVDAHKTTIHLRDNSIESLKKQIDYATKAYDTVKAQRDRERASNQSAMNILRNDLNDERGWRQIEEKINRHLKEYVSDRVFDLCTELGIKYYHEMGIKGRPSWARRGEFY